MISHLKSLVKNVMQILIDVAWLRVYFFQFQRLSYIIGRLISCIW